MTSTMGISPRANYRKRPTKKKIILIWISSWRFDVRRTNYSWFPSNRHATRINLVPHIQTGCQIIFVVIFLSPTLFHFSFISSTIFTVTFRTFPTKCNNNHQLHFVTFTKKEKKKQNINIWFLIAGKFVLWLVWALSSPLTGHYRYSTLRMLRIRKEQNEMKEKNKKEYT